MMKESKYSNLLDTAAVRAFTKHKMSLRPDVNLTFIMHVYRSSDDPPILGSKKGLYIRVLDTEINRYIWAGEAPKTYLELHNLIVGMVRSRIIEGVLLE